MDGTMSSVGGFVASSGGNGTTVRGLHQRRSIHQCSAGGSATSFAATPAKCRQQHGRGLEEALKVLGEDDSIAALQEARRAAQDRPMAAQVECQAFIERSQKRLGRLEEEQAKEQEQLDAAQRRMARFREEMARTVPPTTPTVSETTQPGKIPDLVAELDRLRAQVKSWRPSARRQGRKHSRSLSVRSPDLIN